MKEKIEKVSVNTNFIATGSYLVDGLVKGITDNTFKAEAQARAMALEALDAVKKALNEGFYDEVGGYHDCGIGWSPEGTWCGECTSASCKYCPNVIKEKGEK